MELAKEIRIRRRRAELTLRELAQKTGITESTLCRLESGKLHATQEHIAALAPVLGRALLNGKCAECPVRHARTGTEG